jgi:hypothetical protein
MCCAGDQESVVPCDPRCSGRKKIVEPLLPDVNMQARLSVSTRLRPGKVLKPPRRLIQCLFSVFNISVSIARSLPPEGRGHESASSGTQYRDRSIYLYAPTHCAKGTVSPASPRRGVRARPHANAAVPLRGLHLGLGTILRTHRSSVVCTWHAVWQPCWLDSAQTAMYS